MIRLPVRLVGHLALVVVMLAFAAPVRADSGAAAGAGSGIVEVVSPGGVRAWLRQDSSIPLLAINFRFSGGGSIIAAEKAGTAVLAARMLSEGAGEWDGEQFRQALADNAIGLGFQAGRDTFSGSLTTLTANRDLAVQLLQATLTTPRMADTALRQQKSRLITSRRRSETRPNSIAFRNWFETAYGDHPYSRSINGTPETVASVELPDITGFLAKVLTRNGLVIGVAGDIDPAALGELLDRAFGELPDHAPPADLATAPTPSGGLNVIPHPSQQSVVVFGHAGIAREDPDWYAATVITQILGGSTFTSRLGAEVREKRGLAYGIGANLSPYRAGSILLGRTATRNDAVAETLQIIGEEWQRMADEGPTAAELDEAKTYLIGSFPLSLDSTGAIASVLVQMQVYGLGRDYWTTRAAHYQAVDLAVAQRVARRILQPRSLLQVVVGMPEKLTLATPAKITQ